MNETEKPAVVLFDGVCNFCNSSINFIIDHDKKNYFKFAPLQSEIGQKLLKENIGWIEIYVTHISLIRFY